MPTDDLRTWPTATAKDVNASGAEAYSTASGRHPGVTLTDAVRPWATLTASEAKGRRVSLGRREHPDMLSEQVRHLPTPTATDYKTPAGYERTDGGNPARLGMALQPGFGRRLNPDWVECLVGLPVGWTRPHGPRLTADPDPRWPRGRYPESWERSVEWPGYAWEPRRTLPDGEPVRGRPARIRACGNIVVPQQGALAIRAGLRGPAQRSLF